MKIFFIFCLLIVSNFCISEEVPYNQLVFPNDIDKYPLLFLSEIDGANNVYNIYVDKFILSQSASRNIHHKLIAANSIKEYPIDKYKYLVKPVFLDLATYSEYGTNHSKVVSYVFIDRTTRKEYRPFVDVKPISKKSYDSSYPNWQLKPARPKDYFKVLPKIIKSFEKIGTEKTYEKELKAQRRNGTRMIIPMLVVFTVAGPLTAILINL